MSDNYHQLLGLDKHASREALKRAFREQLKNAHPDHNPDDPTACEHTRKLIEAYKALSNSSTQEQHSPTAFFKYPPIPTKPPLHPIIAQILSVGLFIGVGVAAAMIVGTIADSRHPFAWVPKPPHSSAQQNHPTPQNHPKSHHIPPH